MVEINGGVAPTPAPAPIPNTTNGTSGATANAAGPATPVGTAAPTGQGTEKADAKKPEHAAEAMVGFNPSTRIDADTHMIVLTIRDGSGQTVRQIPNEHELAAYKAESTAHKK